MWDVDEELERARRALEHWSDYPAHEDPRRLVLTGGTVLVGAGFASNDAKQAFLAGEFAAAADVPDEVLRALARHHGKLHGHALRITGAERVSATFDTDRGPRQLPAWRVRIDGVDGPVSVLDPEIARDAAGPEGIDGITGTDMRARLGADERTMILEFLGSPPQYTDYPRAVVLESPAAVTVIPVPHELLEGDRLLYGQQREVTARLRDPLGARVAVDYRSGCPITVDAAPAPQHATAREQTAIPGCGLLSGTHQTRAPRTPATLPALVQCVDGYQL